jgi:hypothetical protein
MMHFLRVLVCGATIAIAISCTHLEPISISPSGSSRHLELDLGGAFQEQRRYLLTEEEVILEIYSPKETQSETTYPLTTQRRLAMTPVVARQVWDSVEDASIQAWKEKYEPSQLGAFIHDGSQWKVQYWDGARQLVRAGDNTYPASEPRGAPTLDLENAFYSLLDALEEAIKSSDNTGRQAMASPSPAT